MVFKNTNDRVAAVADKKKLHLKLARERKAGEVKRSREKLEALMEKPQALVGLRVQHRCSEEGGGEAEWFDGTVMSVYCDHPNPMKVDFSIKYDIDDGVIQINVCTKPVSMHYSFDFAQQVYLPSDPLQPGPMYFLTPRKLWLFGGCCEGIPKQVNYLMDEAHRSTKGSNAVISYLDHFFKFHGLGETDDHLHMHQLLRTK
ncbi:hypothetical protein CAPTEDRAFT_206709 [Capitella teleta]|uniref:Uncharacterized protein n=1 Tax=Capitella teleta TaxID=283909 RepID=R7U1Y2_CAPTE|nr:hypothetical protein CAPTEDRAFT_206709 [Capitella teleta]|eukprot:ELT97676.1 hypothetical protein CAPTEDRAFT_206709 [Capitella teleta]